MKKEDICKLMYTDSRIFTSSEGKIKSAISLLQRFGVEGEVLSKSLGRQPRLLSNSREKIVESLKLAEDLGINKGSRMFATAMRCICGVSKENAERRLQCLSSSGFSEKQVSELLKRWPLILGCSEENMKHRVDFLVKYVGISLDNLVKYPVLFGYSLEKRVLPRYRVMEALKSMQMLKIELICPHIYCLTEKRFLEKYVNKNADSSILLDIYHCGKVDHQQGDPQ